MMMWRSNRFLLKVALSTSLVFGLIFATNECVAQTTDSSEENLLSPRGALLRSAVIPGWGQFYTKHYFKSVGFFATHAYFAYQFYGEHQRLADIEETNRRNRVEYTRNTWAWRYLAAYVLCITDAYVDAHLASFPDDEDALSLGMMPMEAGWMVHLNLSF